MNNKNYSGIYLPICYTYKLYLPAWFTLGLGGYLNSDTSEPNLLYFVTE